MSARSWLLIILSFSILFGAGCGNLNSSGIISGGGGQSDEAVEEQPQDSGKDKEIKEETSLPQKEPSEEPPSPKGSFVLGEYYSQDSHYKFKVWAWYDRSEKKLKADFLFFDFKKDVIKRITRTKLVENRRTNRRDPVVWLDSKRALLNGFILFKVEGYKSYDLKSEEISEVWDYHVNSSGSALALLGRTEEGAGVWLIDLDTLYKLPVYSYSLENPWLEEESFRVAWGPDNNLYFDVDFHGRPAIFRYETLEDKVDLYLYDATLHAIDQESGKIFYTELAENGNTPPQKKSMRIDESPAKSEPQKVLEVATHYMETTGRPVGYQTNKVVLSIERLFENKALVAFGPWASEYNGVLILERNEDNWKVTCEKFRHYFNIGRFWEAVDVLAAREGYIFGEEPGKYVIGCPYEESNLVVFLVGPYGSPWEMQYTLEKNNEGWQITEKMEIQGEIILPTSPDYPGSTLQKFFSAMRNKQYNLAEKLVISPAGKEPELNNWEIVDYDLGEARLLPDGKRAVLQFWLFGEGEEGKDYYGWCRLNKVEQIWKILWESLEKVRFVKDDIS
jgi:hypothetical protein